MSTYYQLHGYLDWRAEKSKFNNNNSHGRGSRRVGIARGRGRMLVAGRGMTLAVINNSSTLGGWENTACDVRETTTTSSGTSNKANFPSLSADQNSLLKILNNRSNSIKLFGKMHNAWIFRIRLFPVYDR